MRTETRLMWILTMGAFLTMVSGCASTNLRLVEEELARSGTGLIQESGQSIEGYLLRDGTKVKYQGKVRLAHQDSLAFWKTNAVEKNNGSIEGDGMVTFNLEPGPVFFREHVKALDVKENKVGASILLATGAFLGVLVVLFATADFKPVNNSSAQ